MAKSATHTHKSTKTDTDGTVMFNLHAKGARPKEPEYMPTKADLTVLNSCASVLAGLDTDATKASFVAGETFAKAKDILPKKQFGDWCASNTSYTVRAAWNFIAIHECFGDRKDRIIKASVPPTSLISLTKADDNVFETVISTFERGERLTGASIKAMIAGEGEAGAASEKAAVYDLPGLSGLRKVAARKQASEVDNFIKLSKLVLAAVIKALEPLEKGKAVRKHDLALAIRYNCRHLDDLLRHMILPLHGEPDKQERWHTVDMSRGTAWQKVRTLIGLLGDDEVRWPQRAEFARWLQNEVVPAFRFILEGVPLPEYGRTLTGIVSEMAKHSDNGDSTKLAQTEAWVADVVADTGTEADRSVVVMVRDLIFDAPSLAADNAQDDQEVEEDLYDENATPPVPAM